MMRKIRTQETSYAETVESTIDTFIMQNTDVSPILQIVLFFRTVLYCLENRNPSVTMSVIVAGSSEELRVK